ncbi:MAG: NUDIX hydrolase [Sciscionella sp.]
MSHGQVVACAVLGREEDVLLIRRTDGVWGLPATPVQPGEWIEDAVRRGMRGLLDLELRAVSFLCLIEHSDGLYVVFDVIPQVENALLLDHDQPDRKWIGPDQLATLPLRPAALRTALHNGEPSPWLPHHLT